MRFLNICVYRKINFYNIETKQEEIQCEIASKDFQKILPVKEKLCVKIAVERRKGIYFWYKKNRKRKWAYVFAGMAFFSLYVVSLFLWDISFRGNVQYTDQMLLRILYEYGYAPGERLSEIDCSALEKLLRKQCDAITWVSVRIEGTRLVVEIKEADRKKEEGKNDETAQTGSLYALHDGIVESIVTTSGVPCVKPGDFVKQGQLLIEGKIPIRNDDGEIVMVHNICAQGEVSILYDAWYEDRINRERDIFVYQSEDTSHAIRVGPIFLGKMHSKSKKDACLEVTREQKQVRLFENLWLPVYFETICTRNYEIKQSFAEDERLRQEAEDSYLQYINMLEENDIHVCEAQMTFSLYEEYALLKGMMRLRQEGAEFRREMEIKEESENNTGNF